MTLVISQSDSDVFVPLMLIGYLQPCVVHVYTAYPGRLLLLLAYSYMYFSVVHEDSKFLFLLLLVHMHTSYIGYQMQYLVL